MQKQGINACFYINKCTFKPSVIHAHQSIQRFYTFYSIIRELFV
jgi:hypothetical protein